MGLQKGYYDPTLTFILQGMIYNWQWSKRIISLYGCVYVFWINPFWDVTYTFNLKFLLISNKLFHFL